MMVIEPGLQSADVQLAKIKSQFDFACEPSGKALRKGPFTMRGHCGRSTKRGLRPNPALNGLSQAAGSAQTGLEH
jgi:hypothetical protein